MSPKVEKLSQLLKTAAENLGAGEFQEIVETFRGIKDGVRGLESGAECHTAGVCQARSG